ncbi:hypothetical protein AB0E59_45990 [Lentzea sp. NPDC034063]|uniref:hypothetical protein n=1 Tax=unclassified Lentzea TaxID=2643253 RepID=UPI0033EB10F3
MRLVNAEILKITGPVEVDLGALDVSGLATRLRDVLEWGAAGKRPEMHVSAAQGPSAS